MTSRAARAGRAAGLLAAAGLACGGCSLLPQAAGPTAPASTTARPAATASPQPSAAAVPLATLLPFPPARLQAAASLAGRFTASWDSWSWRQPPAAWLAALQPMAAASLEPALAQAAGDRGVLARRAAARQTARATVTALAIRDLTPGSVTVTATAAQVITSSSGTGRATAAYAVTLTPEGSGWLVWDIEPADAGNSLGGAPMPPAAERGSATVTVATAAAVLLLLLAVIAGAVGGITGQEASACTAQPAASSAAASIPANYLADFKKAGTEYGIPWTVLAGIGEVESGFGQNDGPSSAGALGPMQFEPSTWALYGDGGNIMDPADAIPAAARLLVANGAPGNLQQAVFAYNHSASYVQLVLSWAARYAAGGAQAVSAAGSAVCQQAALGPLPAGTAGKILAYAEAQLGKSYQYGATGPDAFDCSGLAMMAYRAAGITIPRTSQAQWAYGRQVPASQVQPGDLVFFAGADGTPAAPGHVGIVLDPAAHTMIDAYTAAYPVEEDTYGLPDSKGGLSPVVGFTRPVGSQQ